MEAKSVLYRKEEQIGTITINRPDVRNALSPAVFEALDQVLDEVGRDDDIRTLVVTGAGSVFVAGADVQNLLGFGSLEGYSFSKLSHSVFNKLERLGKPSIAAINGAALGGGLELALACTLSVASANAKMGFPELSLGIIPAFGGTQRLIRAVGHQKAAELLLRSSVITADEALRIGLINSVVEQDQVLKVANEMACEISTKSPVAVRLIMDVLFNSQNEGFSSGLALEAAVACLTLSSAESKKLLRKFTERGKGR